MIFLGVLVLCVAVFVLGFTTGWYFREARYYKDEIVVYDECRKAIENAGLEFDKQMSDIIQTEKAE